jgi:superfamily II DNA or RNA helicase
VPARNNLVLDYFAGDTTLAFCAGIQHAIHLAERAKERGIAAEAVWGDDPERKEKLARFHDGTTRLLTSADLLLVGYDEPRISTILMARPTQSRVLWTQAVGRGTRLYPGKECLRLFDFADIGMDLCGLEDLSEDDTLPVTRRLMPFAVGAEVEHKKDGRRGVVVQVELQHLVKWAPSASTARCRRRRRWAWRASPWRPMPTACAACREATTTPAAPASTARPSA